MLKSPFARSENLIGLTQYHLKQFAEALKSHERAFEIRCEVFSKEHSAAASSFREIERTQLAALESALELD